MPTLGKGVRRGRATHSSGTRIWLEYDDSTYNRGVSNLDSLKDALERVVMEACISEGCNWAKIISIFHTTTRNDQGKLVSDYKGLHVTALLSYESNGIRQSPDKAHIYVSGVNGQAHPDRWYDFVRVREVRWEANRTGSSQGSSLPGGSTPGASSTGSASGKRGSSKGKSPSPARGQASSSSSSRPQAAATQVAADGWYNDPWKQARLRYFQNGSWTGQTAN